jgi:hypothetical protein
MRGRWCETGWGTNTQALALGVRGVEKPPARTDRVVGDFDNLRVSAVNPIGG